MTVFRVYVQAMILSARSLKRSLGCTNIVSASARCFRGLRGRGARTAAKCCATAAHGMPWQQMQPYVVWQS
eukprot:325593-Chlamydomonas_euryale.AAC.7